MSLSARLKPFVSAGVRERGRTYAYDRNVHIDSVSRDAVVADVVGSGLYVVSLKVDGQNVFSSCTCPFVKDYGAVCKHIWATVLTAEPRGFASHLLAPGLYLETHRGKFPTAPPPPPRETWKDLIARLGHETKPVAEDRPAKAAGATQFVFIVDGPASAQALKLVFDVHSRDRKQNGDWGVSRPYAVHKNNIAGLRDEADRHLFALLNGAENASLYGYSYGSYGSSAARYLVGEPLLGTVLDALAATGRIFYRPDVKVAPEPLTPDSAPPWEVTLEVERGADGKNWFLSGRLRRGEESMPVTTPALIVPGVVVWSGRIGRLTGDAFATVPQLRRTGPIPVPASKGEELVDQLMAMPRLPRLTLPDELKYDEVAVAPVPRLLVKPSPTTYGPPVLFAELSFDYDGTVVPLRPTTRGVFRPEGRRFLLRDPAAEQLAEDTIARLGVKTNIFVGQPRLELKPALLAGLTRELLAAGWHVEADGKLFRRPDAIDISVKSGQDWFDLEGAADFGGQKIPFPRLLEALIRGESTVQLDDGTIGMLPDDWLKKYGLIGQMGTVEGDALRFTRAQAGVLDALLASRPEVTFDKQFAKARDDLRKFSGVAPADPPKQFTGELREYQREGLGWLKFLRKFGFGGCLADDMGLGKTVQVLAVLAAKRSGPALVVVPKSLIFNWKSEAARFAPKLKVLDHTGPDRDRTLATFTKYDIILTTYGTLRNDAAAFAAVHFDTCVLDESQAAKNAATDTAKAVKVVRADHRLAMSGTPVENHLGELWTLFDFLNPGLLGRALAPGTARNPDPETREFLARALKPYILRRTKAQVAKDLPEKTEQTVYCDLEPAQRKLYDELRDHYRHSLLARVATHGLARSKIQVLEALLRLRQAACHPGLIDKTKAADPSAKLDVLLPHLRDLAEAGTKVFVFSQFTALLAIVRERLDAEGSAYEYLDGRTRDRAACVARFQTDPACKLFLISLKAGGVGLNLTAAEYVFLLDPWWNPAVEAQAIDRSHRIGQTKPVFAYRLIARNTVEEKVLALQQSKRELADSILSGDGRPLADLKREDLELLLS